MIRAILLFLFVSVVSFGADPSPTLELLLKQKQVLGWTFDVGDQWTLPLPTEKITGLIVPPDWRVGARFMELAPEPLPSHFDWREHDGVSSVRNQGACASCWAFATVSVFESAVRIQDKINVDFSEQQLLSCNKEGWDCTGGYFAHQYHQTPGADLEKDFPYAEKKGACEANVSPSLKIESWSYIGTPGSRPSNQAIKTAIFEHGPVAATVEITKSFKAYSGGIYNACDGTGKVNHMLTIVGWDDEQGAWILRNSWGTAWGEKGYMRLKYGCNSIATQATSVVYKPSCSPPPIADSGHDTTILRGQSAQLGGVQIAGARYHWTPEVGLDNPEIADPLASPPADTIYTLEMKTQCGVGKSSVKVSVIQ